MTTQICGLQEALENAGWSIVEVVTINLDWWADEVWVLRQDRDERIVFLTFVDPAYDAVRKKGEGVWAVTASSRELQNRWGEKTLSLRRGWAKRLPAFIKSLDEIQQLQSP